MDVVAQLMKLLSPSATVEASALSSPAPVRDAAVPGSPGDVRYQMLSRQLSKNMDPLTRTSMLDTLAASPELSRHTRRIRTEPLSPGLLGRTDGSTVTVDTAQSPGPMASTVLGHEMTHAKENATWPLWRKALSTMDQGGRRVAGLVTGPETAYALEQGGSAEKAAYGSESDTYNRLLELIKHRAHEGRVRK